MGHPWLKTVTSVAWQLRRARRCREGEQAAVTAGRVGNTLTHPRPEPATQLPPAQIRAVHLRPLSLNTGAEINWVEDKSVDPDKYCILGSQA